VAYEALAQMRHLRGIRHPAPCCGGDHNRGTGSAMPFTTFLRNCFRMRQSLQFATWVQLGSGESRAAGGVLPPEAARSQLTRFRVACR
jgi:hypothetical protein